MMEMAADLHFKDQILDKISEVANIAQFVSFSPKVKQRHSRVIGFEPNHEFASLTDAVEALLKASVDHSVNVRSYKPEFPKSGEFVYGLKKPNDVIEKVLRLAYEGLYTIINETIDINDGGVSGVALGNVIEFAPGVTPRVVETSDAAALPREFGLKILETIYHFRPKLDFEKNLRVEFSTHPLKRGYKNDHTIIWETEDVGDTCLEADITWPNLFSKCIGDKAYGLLIGSLMGLRVPETKVFSRALAPFNYGITTGSNEFWIRTCPTEQVPGKYTTRRGWTDPFKLMCMEDPEGDILASVLSQEGIEAVYSGALITSLSGEVTIEGAKGYGDKFMLGQVEKAPLPEKVRVAVEKAYEIAKERLGFVRIEWVFDGVDVWVVQLHKGATVSSGRTIVPGDATYFHRFEVKKGIEDLRTLISKINGNNEGIELIGNIGITSHFGDILRRAKIPSKIVEI